MDKRTHYPVEARERAVRMAFEHGPEYDSPCAAIRSIADKLRDESRDAAAVGTPGGDRRGPETGPDDRRADPH